MRRNAARQDVAQQRGLRPFSFFTARSCRMQREFCPGARYIKIPRNPRSHCFTLIHETGTCQAHCNRIVFAFLATYSCAKILNHVTGIMQLVRYYVKNILSRERIQCFAHPPAVSMSRHHNRITGLFNYYTDCG